MSGNKPSYRASISLGTKEKPRYREVGCAFNHKDGKGLTLLLDLMPPSGAPIILRRIGTGEVSEVEGGGQ